MRRIDTGNGIPDKKQETLLESFSQEDVSTARLFGGTGLGLVIAPQLAELMSGTIGVDREMGSAVDFGLRLTCFYRWPGR